MTEKVLGFRKKDIDEIRDVWEVPFNAYNKVPVVTVERHERIIEALNKSHLKDTAFLIKLRAKERRKVWKLEKELKAVRLQVKKK